MPAEARPCRAFVFFFDPFFIFFRSSYSPALFCGREVAANPPRRQTITALYPALQMLCRKKLTTAGAQALPGRVTLVRRAKKNAVA
jgi:hypothetical protein